MHLFFSRCATSSWHASQHDSLQTHTHHYNKLKEAKSLDLVPVMCGDAADMCWVQSGAVSPDFRRILHQTSTKLRKKKVTRKP